MRRRSIVVVGSFTYAARGRDDDTVSRITRVEAWPVNVPLVAPYLMAPVEPSGPGLGVTLDERALARTTERFAREGAYHLSSAPPLPHH